MVEKLDIGRVPTSVSNVSGFKAARRLRIARFLFDTTSIFALRFYPLRVLSQMLCYLGVDLPKAQMTESSVDHLSVESSTEQLPNRARVGGGNTAFQGLATMPKTMPTLCMEALRWIAKIRCSLARNLLIAWRRDPDSPIESPHVRMKRALNGILVYGPSGFSLSVRKLRLLTTL